MEYPGSVLKGGLCFCHFFLSGGFNMYAMLWYGNSVSATDQQGGRAGVLDDLGPQTSPRSFTINWQWYKFLYCLSYCYFGCFVPQPNLFSKAKISWQLKVWSKLAVLAMCHWRNTIKGK